MAAIYMRRPEQFYESADSLGSVLLRENPLWNRGSDKNELPPQEKQFDSISKALISAVSRNKKNDNFAQRPTMVRTSALLYEITDRTNQLAQPRIRSNSDEKNRQQSEYKSNRIPEATPRVIELSRPRMVFKLIPKPTCNVSPNALKAIATQRIIELSKPRKIRHAKLPRKKKRNSYASCSARLEYLSKPRLYHRKVKMKSSNRKSLSLHLKSKNEKKTSWRKPRYNMSSKSGKKYKKLGRQNKKRKRFLEASGSSRSVIMVSSFDQCNHRPQFRGHESKKRAKRKLAWTKHYLKKNPLIT